MNGAHLHLLVNHVSLFSVVIGFVTLAASMKRKSPDLRVLATALFLIAGIFAAIAFETGEKAEDVIKALGGDTDPLILQHSQAATWARLSGGVVGTLAIAMEWAIRSKKKWAKYLQWALLLFALHGCTVYMATAFLGGKIRHVEVR